MFHAEKVKIDVDYVNRYLEKKFISKREFSEMNGHSRSWWNSIEACCGCMVAVNQAKLICTLTGLDYEKLVIPEKPITSNAFPHNEQKHLMADDESIQVLVNSLNRIEQKMDEAAIGLTRLEIQMRTVLKELGVK